LGTRRCQHSTEPGWKRAALAGSTEKIERTQLKLIAELKDAIYLTERCTWRSKGQDSKMVFDFGRTGIQFALTPWLSRSQFKETSASR
jgi:hypothetical protein